MSGLVQGIHHLNIKAEDCAEFDALVRFYTEVLGLTVNRRWENSEKKGIMLSAGNALMEITQNPQAGRGTGAIDHVAFSVADVDLAVKTMREAGFPIIKEPFESELPMEPPSKLRIAFCNGPAGEVIEFFCEL